MSGNETIQAFVCQQCGHCCQGEGGIVMDDKDQLRLARHLGLELETFLDRYAETRGDKYYLRTGEDGYCVFFGPNCRVHPAKPDVCRAWPFFRGNLVDALSWEMAADYCPGIQLKAGHEAFVAQARISLAEDGVVQATGERAPNALKP